MSAAKELRDAAQRLRTLAEVASRRGPWMTSANRPTGSGQTFSVRVKDHLPSAGDWIPSWFKVADGCTYGDAEFIAAMHPGVALALARLLDETAETWRLDGYGDDPWDTEINVNEFIDLARLINGGAS